MKLFFTTKEVAEHLDISESKLGFYVTEFRLRINKVGRVKKYSHKDLEKLEQIMALTAEEGYTLDGAKEKLKSKVRENSKNEEIKNRLLEVRKTLEVIQNAIEAQ